MNANTMALTEREEALIVELRSARKRLYETLHDSPEFKDSLKEVNRITEALTFERYQKRRARMAVDFLNAKPVIDDRIFKAFRPLTVFILATLSSYIYFSGDTQFSTWPAYVLAFMLAIGLSGCYLGYIRGKY